MICSHVINNIGKSTDFFKQAFAARQPRHCMIDPSRVLLDDPAGQLFPEMSLWTIWVKIPPESVDALLQADGHHDNTGWIAQPPKQEQRSSDHE